jgi:hypothetical protein
MIQRIQTVYLLIAEMLIAALFFVPFAEIAVKEGSGYRFDINGIYPLGVPNPEIILGSLPLVILWALSLILILVTIFVFKNRTVQMRISSINIFLMFSLSGLIYYYGWSGAKMLTGVYSFKIYLVFPLIAAIIIYLAKRAINKDELLVRSIDRIR